MVLEFDLNDTCGVRTLFIGDVGVCTQALNALVRKLTYVRACVSEKSQKESSCSVFVWTLRRLHSSMMLEFDLKH